MVSEEPLPWSLWEYPQGRGSVSNFLQNKLNEEQRISILLVEQNAKLAISVAPYAYVMETGRIVMDDYSEKLSQNEDIKDFYLGLTDKGGRKSFRDVKHYKRRKRWLS